MRNCVYKLLRENLEHKTEKQKAENWREGISRMLHWRWQVENLPPGAQLI